MSHDSYLPAEIRLIYLPYALKRLDDGRYVVLNRHYKPLGVSSTDWVDYAPHAIGLKGLTTKRAIAMSWKASDDLTLIYFYSDGCIPTHSADDWAAYQKRLAVFAKLKAV